MKIGLFLGKFDPIHIGHQLSIMKALDKNRQEYVQKVIIIPDFENVTSKLQLTPFSHRFNMCNAIAHQMYRESGKHNVVVSDIAAKMEVNNRYSYLVLEDFKKQYPHDELFIICGTDTVDEISNWKNNEWILTNFKTLVLNRFGDSQTQEPVITLNSTYIRQLIEKGKNPLPLISTVTYAHIKRNHLYNCKFKY